MLSIVNSKICTICKFHHKYFFNRNSLTGFKNTMHLGVLLGCSPQHLILRAQDWEETITIPDIGETVYDAQKVSIGKIADIFGPVKKPFVSVLLNKTAGFTLPQFQEKKGQSFYTLPSKKKDSAAGSRSKKPKHSNPRHSAVPSSQRNKSPSHKESNSQRNKRSE